MDTAGSRTGAGIDGKQIAGRLAVAVNALAVNGVDFTHDGGGNEIQSIAGAAQHLLTK